MTNSEIWPFWINKLLIKSHKNNIPSNWPFVAAKAYTFENHFELAEKIYLTANTTPDYLGLLTTAVIKNKYEAALNYVNILIKQQDSPNLYAMKANIQNILGNKKDAIIDFKSAQQLCKKEKACLSEVKKLFNNFSYDCHQNYFEQRKMLGFE